MDGIGEVDRRGPVGEDQGLALRREDVDLRGQDVALQQLQKLLGVVPLTRAALQGLAHPHQPGVQAVGGDALGLVEPMGGDPVLREPVHLLGPNLHLHGRAESHDRGVQRLVHVALGGGDVVVELPRDRNPQGVDDAQHGIAGGHVLHQDADGQDVVQLVHGELLALHLLVDAVIMLGPALDLAGNPLLGQAGLQRLDPLTDDLLHLRQLLLGLAPNLAVDLRLEVTEGQVLEVPLNLIDPQAVRERGEDLERLLRDALLLVSPERTQGPHVVQPVRKLDQDDPDVPGHHDEHLPQVLRLVALHRHEGQLAQLRHAADQRQDVLAERGAQLLGGHRRVLQDVVQQGRRQGGQIQLHVRENGRRAQGMDDVGIPRHAFLVGVGPGGEDEGLAQTMHLRGGEEGQSLGPELSPGRTHALHPARFRDLLQKGIAQLRHLPLLVAAGELRDAAQDGLHRLVVGTQDAVGGR